MSFEVFPIIVAYSASIVLYIVGGIFGFVLVVLLILLLLRSFKRRSQNNGQAIEEAIDPKITLRALHRLTQSAIREEKYQHSVIYLYYEFRIFCEEKLTIRNARDISSEKLVALVAGTPNISLNDVKKFSSIYDSARYSNDEINKRRSDLAQQLLRDIIQS